MATVSRTIGSVYDPDGGMATLAYDYDDATLLLLAVRIVNGANATARLVARRADGTGQTYTLDGPAGQTTEQAIGTNQAQRLQLSVTPSGKLDGVEINFGLL